MSRLWGSYGRGGGSSGQLGFPILLGIALFVAVGYLLQSGGGGANGGVPARDVQMIR